MKTAPVIRALRRRPDEFEHVLVHTGQHYDDEMWRVFVEELGVEDPLHDLRIGSGSHAQQVARTVERLEPVLHDVAPDLVIVPGDVNSTLGAAVTAAGVGIPIAHIEAGLRSFDRTMPEELNRRVVDQLSRFLFIHSPEAHGNLIAEGADAASIHFVGNTMIDTLVAMWPRIERARAPAAHGVVPREYVLVTLHRPALVDTPLLGEAMSALEHIADHYVVLFPVHPRTRAALAAEGFAPTHPRLRLLRPLGYVDFVGLLQGAAGVVTDSGGIQEEATYLRVPCFTLRQTTERPITVSVGSNLLLGLEPERLRKVPELIEAARGRPSSIPDRWDGQASERVVDVLAGELGVAALTGAAAPDSADRNAANVARIVSSGSGGRESA